MAGTIDQAKMKFSRIVNSRSYTRFNQSQNPEGESSRVEVKLSVDGEEEEMDGAEQCQVTHETYTRSSRSEPMSRGKIICLVTGVLLIFCIGLLLGYTTHRKADPLPCSSPAGGMNDEAQQNNEVPAASLDWSELVKLLNTKLSPDVIQNKLREYSTSKRLAGSSEDNILGDKIHSIFQSLQMDPWVDEHYVKLQTPDSSKPNKVLFGPEEIGSPQGFLAYSATGRADGRVVYGNYGELEDLWKVKDEFSLNLTGSVILLRAGRISMAEKVANAAKMGAVATLIYPDPIDYGNGDNTELYGHVHLGSGDPYTPGFPSFNHTQFPPAKSSGLPNILAQTITAVMARKIMEKMNGPNAPRSFQGYFSSYKLGGVDKDLVSVIVNNVLVDTKIHNVFGVIKGFVDADRYVVIGAQRDSINMGYAKSTVGTTLLLELARAFTEMKKEGFRPRRSIVFASWSAGDFGNVGITEWLEGYLVSLDRKAFTYISLDGVVTGSGSFKASASPLLHTLLQKTLEKVKNPVGLGSVDSRSSLFQTYGRDLSSLLKPMQMDDGAYPFLALSGIPSVSFSFISPRGPSDYKYFGTALDDESNLKTATGQKVGELAMGAAQVAGQMALRLVHDHILKLDVTKYAEVITEHVNKIIKTVNDLRLPETESLSTEWLNAAKSSYGRAAASLDSDIKNSDTEDVEMCRIISNRIMKVEHNFLSPYSSLRDIPFRHVFFGVGQQTTTDLEKYLSDVIEKKETLDKGLVLNRFALLTWTIQGCANDLAGDIWSLDNEI